MAAYRLLVAPALLSLGAAAATAFAAPGGVAPEHWQPFTVQDLVRLERVSELAASPDGKRVA